MLSRKYYEAIAKIVKDGQECCSSPRTHSAHLLKYLATELTDYFENDNPRFDRKRFLAACGLGD